MPRCCCYYCCAIIFNTRYYYCYGDVGLLGLKLCNAVVFLLSLKCQLGLDLVRHKSICSSGSSNSAKHFFHTHARSSSVRLLQKVSFCNNNSRLVTAVSEARKKAESWRCSSSKKKCSRLCLHVQIEKRAGYNLTMSKEKSLSPDPNNWRRYITLFRASVDLFCSHCNKRRNFPGVGKFTSVHPGSRERERDNHTRSRYLKLRAQRSV
jgi:hypothetical protein